MTTPREQQLEAELAACARRLQDFVRMFPDDKQTKEILVSAASVLCASTLSTSPTEEKTCETCVSGPTDCHQCCPDVVDHSNWQPKPVAPVEDKESTKHCVLCPMPETSGALYPMGDELWCGTCCASEVRRLRATPRYAPTRDDCVSILDDRAFLRMLDCAALANPAIRQATCSYAEGVLAERKRREKGGGR